MRIIAIAASSLNGLITRGKETGTAFTSPADKSWFAQSLKSFPIRIMGRKTFEASREFILQQVAREPTVARYVLTNTPEAYRDLFLAGRLEFTSEPIRGLVERITDRKEEKSDVAVLGGGNVYGAFLKEGLLDEFWITLEPQLFGAGTPLIAGDLESKLKLIECRHLSADTLLLKYACAAK